jgi:hypothetical protein
MKINFSGLFGLCSIAAMIYGCYLKGFMLGWLWLYVAIATIIYVSVLFSIFDDSDDLDKLRNSFGLHLGYLFLAYGIYLDTEYGIFSDIELGLWSYIGYFISAGGLGFIIPWLLLKPKSNK